MTLISLKNNTGRTLQFDSSRMWFIDFGLMLPCHNADTSTLVTATSIKDVYRYLADKENEYGAAWLANPEDMKNVHIRLTPPERKFFIQLWGQDLCPQNGLYVNRREAKAAAAKFGLLPCPRDTPLFTYMQTKGLVSAPGRLYFPSRAFRWNGGLHMLGLDSPLDFTSIHFLEDAENIPCLQHWAFEVPPEKINPEKLEWKRNRLTLSGELNKLC